MPKLSVVIPVYKAEDCVEELTQQLLATLETISDDFEIIFVEDAGGDSSWDLITGFASKDPRIKGIKFCRNFGQPYALSAGLDFAQGDWIVVMDCDLQDQPHEIPRLYEKANEGFDLVLARRVGDTRGAANGSTSRWFYRVFDYLTGTKTDPAVGAFRILSRKVANTFRDMPERHRFFGGMIQWMGYRTAYVDVEHATRFAGKSSYNFRRRLNLALDGIISFSNKPLVLSIRFGGLILVFSVVFAATLIYRKIFHDIPVNGYTSIMVTLFFLGSIIIMNLGIVGIYIGRIYDQAKRRPLYIIEKTTLDE